MKETVSEILSAPKYKEDNTQLITVSLEPLCVRPVQRYVYVN